MQRIAEAIAAPVLGRHLESIAKRSVVARPAGRPRAFSAGLDPRMHKYELRALETDPIGRLKRGPVTVHFMTKQGGDIVYTLLAAYRKDDEGEFWVKAKADGVEIDAPLSKLGAPIAVVD